MDRGKFTARAEIWSFGGELLESKDFPIELAYASSGAAGLLPELGDDKFACLSLLSGDGSVLATNTVVGKEYKDCRIEAARIKAEARQNGPAWTKRRIRCSPIRKLQGKPVSIPIPEMFHMD